VNYGVFSPSVSSAFNGASCGGACTDMGDPVCSCTVSASYWSSTDAGGGGNAIAVDFDEGAVGGPACCGKSDWPGSPADEGQEADFGKPLIGYVRAVRGGL
jgi:hypothetical protein